MIMTALIDLSRFSTTQVWTLLAIVGYLIPQVQSQQQDPTATAAAAGFGDVAGTPYTCNILRGPTTDASCPVARPWQLDKKCEPYRLEDGACTDCLDCDPCRDFQDCNACLTAATIGVTCYWCPGDALCSSFAIAGEQWTALETESEIGTELQPSCRALEDWKSTTCDVTTPAVAAPAAGTNATATATASTSYVFNDPLYDSMRWLYDMINVAPVWEEGIRGKGVRVRVNDIGGVDGVHVEFANRFDFAHSCEQYKPPTIVSPTPMQGTTGNVSVGEALVEMEEEKDQHGTAVASLAVGGGNSNSCAVGIAPEAILSACILPPKGNPFVYATTLIINLEAMDISINAWSLDACVLAEQQRRKRRERRRRNLQEAATAGTCPFSQAFSDSPCAACATSITAANTAVNNADLAALTPECRQAIMFYCTNRFELDMEVCTDYLSVYAECEYDTVLSQEEQAAMEIATQQGRDGKGIIYVMSSGNQYVYGGSTNGQKYVLTRYTISVGAVDKGVAHSSYSNPGSSLFVTGPGGDLKHLSNLHVAKVGGGCHDIGPGTSFSAPVVGGVVALLLQARPELTWRDVQGILASTSQKINPEDPTWITNAANFSHSRQFGFGLVDAHAAVEAAKTWELWAPEAYLTAQSDMVNMPIWDTGPTGEPTLSALTIRPGNLTFTTESVEVHVRIMHPSRGDLTVRVTSPQGTESILFLGPRPENSQIDDEAFWQSMTVKAWGEDPAGNWILSIQDERPGDLRDDCVNRPYSYILPASPEAPDGAKVTCSSIRRTKTCADGTFSNPDVGLLVDYVRQISPVDACCVCGGGILPPDVGMLIQWRMIVYGRADEVEVVEAPPANITNTTSGGTGEMNKSFLVYISWLVVTAVLLGL